MLWVELKNSGKKNSEKKSVKRAQPQVELKISGKKNSEKKKVKKGSGYGQN